MSDLGVNAHIASYILTSYVEASGDMEVKRANYALAKYVKQKSQASRKCHRRVEVEA